MGENDRTMRIVVKADQLQKLLIQRAKAHEGRAKFYANRERILREFIKKNVGTGGAEDPVRGGKVSNSSLVQDAQQNLSTAAQVARAHRAAAEICRFMAANVEKGLTVFTGEGLTTLAYLTDTENPSAMPPFYRG